MKRFIALLVSGVALTACASPTEPTDAASTRVSRVNLARKALVGATQKSADAPNARISFN